ncbi:MAG: acyl carrier protein [Candidatus Pelagibacter sp.]|nr:acyl carrier protein [Candidatus Pelagibacter sp.]|tara:strand:+ start:611 stop:850 length:240 start_codon:yes stop_codon:yes gene_type:complete
MSNLEKYRKVFLKSLSVDESKVNDKLKYNDIPEWDSIGHMTLMSGLEEEFKISIETDDIVDFSSFEKGKEILKKYKVNF